MKKHTRLSCLFSYILSLALLAAQKVVQNYRANTLSANVGCQKMPKGVILPQTIALGSGQTVNSSAICTEKLYTHLKFSMPAPISKCFFTIPKSILE